MALRGIHHYFKHRSDEEREHATQLMYYQNQRGGRIILVDIKVRISFEVVLKHLRCDRMFGKHAYTTITFCRFAVIK